MQDQEAIQTKAWVARWKETSIALEEIKTEELSALTQEESGRLFADMAVDTDTIWISPDRESSVGFIEQQRLFMLSDEHPARPSEPPLNCRRSSK